MRLSIEIENEAGNVEHVTVSGIVHRDDDAYFLLMRALEAAKERD